MDSPAVLELPPQPLSARRARRWMSEQMTGSGLEPLADAVELLTVEVVTNALLHAGTHLEVRLHRHGPGVEVEVQDGSVVPPHRQHFSRTATTGRGVGLLDDLADEWGWRLQDDGKTVWFRVLRARDTWSSSDLPGPDDFDVQGVARA